MDWFGLLKWLSEQQDATTVAELQQRFDAMVELLKGMSQANHNMIVFFGVLLIAVVVWITYLHLQLEKVKKALPEKAVPVRSEKSNLSNA